MVTWGDEPPSGAGGAARTAPDGSYQGAEWRKRVKAARAAWNAELIRRKTRRSRGGGRYRPGMTRKPPPPDGDGADAA